MNAGGISELAQMKFVLPESDKEIGDVGSVMGLENEKERTDEL